MMGFCHAQAVVFRLSCKFSKFLIAEARTAVCFYGLQLKIARMCAFLIRDALEIPITHNDLA